LHERPSFSAKSHVTNPTSTHAAYIKEALSKKFAQISLIDRKDLLDYLTGKAETSANVVGLCTLESS
jgi:hypothetical protein